MLVVLKCSRSCRPILGLRVDGGDLVLGVAPCCCLKIVLYILALPGFCQYRPRYGYSVASS